jgi:hypothetical protein
MGLQAFITKTETAPATYYVLYDISVYIKSKIYRTIRKIGFGQNFLNWNIL